MVKSTLKGLMVQGEPFGFHAWLKLPEPWRAETFVRQPEKQSIRFLQAELFDVGSTATPQAVRLCVSSPESDHQVQFALETIRDSLMVESTPICRPMVF